MHAVSTLFTVLASLSVLATPIAALPAPSRGSSGAIGVGADNIAAPFGGPKSGGGGRASGGFGGFGAGGAGDVGVQDFQGKGDMSQGEAEAGWTGQGGDAQAQGKGAGPGGFGGIFGKRQESSENGKGCKAKPIAGSQELWAGPPGGRGGWGSGSGSGSGSGAGAASSVAPVPAPATQEVPVPTQQAPAPTQEAAVPTQQAPVPTQETPVPSQQAPAPVPTQEAPAPAPEPPVPAPQPSAAPSGGGGANADPAGNGPFTGQGTYYDAVRDFLCGS